MRGWRFTGILLLTAFAAQPCSVSYVRQVWAKKPGSRSNLFAFERNGKVGFINSSGRVVISPAMQSSVDDVGDFSDGLALVRAHGYIDERGRLAIKKQWWSESDFSDGLAQVTIREAGRPFGWGYRFIDSKGKVVATVPGQGSRDFSEGLAPYEAEGKPGIRGDLRNMLYLDFPGLKGFIDRTSNIAIPATFAEVGPFVGGLARAVLDGYCHIATAENYREGTPTTGYPTSCGGFPADAVTPCKVGFIGRDGEFAIEPRFESAQDFREGFAAVRLGGKWGFIDTAGRMVIQPQFEQVYSFREGLAAILLDGKWGFIDWAGKLVVGAQFDRVESFSDSLALVYRGDRPSYLDKGGRIVIAGPFAEATSFVNGLAAVRHTENRVLYIDHAGKTVFQYDRRAWR